MPRRVHRFLQPNRWWRWGHPFRGARHMPGVDVQRGGPLYRARRRPFVRPPRAAAAALDRGLTRRTSTRFTRQCPRPPRPPRWMRIAAAIDTCLAGVHERQGLRSRAAGRLELVQLGQSACGLDPAAKNGRSGRSRLRSRRRIYCDEMPERPAAASAAVPVPDRVTVLTCMGCAAMGREERCDGRLL
jgi:hypothetical protein